jgi:hypothetical protein
MAKLSQSMKSATGPGAGAGRREVRSVATVYGVSFHAGTGRGASWRNLAYFEGSRQQPVRFLERIDPDPARVDFGRRRRTKIGSCVLKQCAVPAHYRGGLTCQSLWYRESGATSSSRL